MQIIGTNIVVPDSKIPIDLSTFTKEKCERAEDWYNKHKIPIILPHQTWDECRDMYKALKQRRIFWQRRSDEAAMLFFGMTNEQIYRKLKSHFTQDGKVSDDEILVTEDVSILESYGLKNSLVLVNEYMRHKLGPVDIYRLKKISEYFKPKTIDLSDIITEGIYFTPDEIYDRIGTYDKHSLVSYKPWLEEYNLIFNGIQSDKFMGLGLERVKLLQKFGLDDSKEAKETKLRLGWNPEIPYNEHTISIANNRLKRILNERFSNIDIVNISELIECCNGSIEESLSIRLRPMFIVFKRTKTSLVNNIISKATSSFWAHAAMSFDPSLRTMYTFDMRDGGFSTEDIKRYAPGSIVNVICCFISDSAYNRVSQEIKQFMRNRKETSYGFQNFISCLTGKANENTKSMVCSNFVDYMMKIGEISPTKHSWSTIHPGKLRRAIASDRKKRFYEIYKGPIENYNSSKVMLYLSQVSNQVGLNEDKELNKFEKECKELYKTIVEPYVGMEVIEE